MCAEASATRSTTPIPSTSIKFYLDSTGSACRCSRLTIKLWMQWTRPGRPTHADEVFTRVTPRFHDSTASVLKSALYPTFLQDSQSMDRVQKGLDEGQTADMPTTRSSLPIPQHSAYQNYCYRVVATSSTVIDSRNDCLPGDANLCSPPVHPTRSSRSRRLSREARLGHIEGSTRGSRLPIYVPRSLYTTERDAPVAGYLSDQGLT